MSSKLKPAQIFTDNMVLQRDVNIPVWGKAADGSKIRVEFNGQVCETEAVDGKWCVNLLPISAGGPYSMTIQSGTDVMEFKNILIGEVWIAGGQSNMQFLLKDSLSGKEEISRADYENIRYYDVPRVEYEDGCTKNEEIQKTVWKVCSPVNAGDFSAVAFYFAKDIFNTLKVPVGIIGCNMGATSASCWMSEEYLSSGAQIRIYLDEYYEHIGKVSDEEYDAQLEAFNKQFEEHTKKIEEFKASHPDADEGLINRCVGLYPWPPPMGRKSFMRPAGLYHTMLKKIIPYAVKGVIFYQGEGDIEKAGIYRELFAKMIRNWRDDWNNPALPFLFVQLTYFGNVSNSEGTSIADGEEWAVLREQQMLAARTIDNTAMAVITDCGEIDNIHPTNKHPVGERLALLARARIYGQDIECSGPVYRNMEINGHKAVLYFDHSRNGLVAKDGELMGFEICGEDRRFVKAEAVIKGNMVEVFAEKIEAPAAVRYGWANYMKVNLYNSEGLPASPFRTAW